MTVDFHAHTRESDGALTPPELAARMRDRGVQFFSITDHDTLRAYGQFDAEFATVIPGLEINTTWQDEDVHVLGYRVPLGDDGPLAAVLADNRAFRQGRVARIVAALAAAGYPIALADVLERSGGADAIGRPHVARALVAAGHVRDVQTAFDRLLARGRPAYLPANQLTPADAIDAIRAAGGLPVLAHPGRLRDETLVDELIERGLAGLEVFYPTHTPAQTARFRERAARAALVMTAGSDFHDARWSARGVGMEVEAADIRPFLDLVGAG